MGYTYDPVPVRFRERDRQRYKKVFAKESKLSANQRVMELMEDEKWKGRGFPNRVRVHFRGDQASNHPDFGG